MGEESDLFSKFLMLFSNMSGDDIKFFFTLLIVKKKKKFILPVRVKYRERGGVTFALVKLVVTCPVAALPCLKVAN